MYRIVYRIVAHVSIYLSYRGKKIVVALYNNVTKTKDSFNIWYCVERRITTFSFNSTTPETTQVSIWAVNVVIFAEFCFVLFCFRVVYKPAAASLIYTTRPFKMIFILQLQLQQKHLYVNITVYI